MFFTKGTHTMNGPFDPIPFDPQVSTQIDWEGELAVIIGKHGRNIPEARAMDHVFGYCVINDTTARDVQTKRHGGQWFKGKSLDGHGPMGPWIIPAAELDYDNLHILTRVNGVVKQDASTRQMYFKVPRIIAELSLGLTLEPGDIIATGTPARRRRRPQPAGVHEARRCHGDRDRRDRHAAQPDPAGAELARGFVRRGWTEVGRLRRCSRWGDPPRHRGDPMPGWSLRVEPRGRRCDDASGGLASFI